MGGPILLIRASYDVFFLREELPLEGHNDCSYVIIFRGINFLVAINSLRR